MNILLNGNAVEELGTIVHASKAVNLGRKMVLKLVELIPRQMFQVIKIIVLITNNMDMNSINFNN